MLRASYTRALVQLAPPTASSPLAVQRVRDGAVFLASVSRFCKGLGLSMHISVSSCKCLSLCLIMSVIHCQYCFVSRINSKWSPPKFCECLSGIQRRERTQVSKRSDYDLTLDAAIIYYINRSKSSSIKSAVSKLLHSSRELPSTVRNKSMPIGIRNKVPCMLLQWDTVANMIIWLPDVHAL